MALLDAEHDPAFVGLETTLLVEPFYQRFGFERLARPEQRFTGGLLCRHGNVVTDPTAR
jgi:hypothetical protein